MNRPRRPLAICKRNWYDYVINASQNELEKEEPKSQTSDEEHAERVARLFGLSATTPLNKVLAESDAGDPNWRPRTFVFTHG